MAERRGELQQREWIAPGLVEQPLLHTWCESRVAAGQQNLGRRFGQRFEVMCAYAGAVDEASVVLA